jgi:hypothetical protein
MLDRNENYWFSKFYNANTAELAVDDSIRIQDTYITNVSSAVTVSAFERRGQKFIQLNDVEVGENTAEEEYSGGKNSNILYQNRPTTKVGGQGNSTYRSLFIFDVKSSINNTISTISGYQTGMDYSILNANLTLTLFSGISGSNLQAFMVSTDSIVDESASWTQPSQEYTATWNEGGTVEPLSAEISPQSYWNGTDVSFDITPFFNIWKSSGKNTIAVVVKGAETDDSVSEFFTQQSATPLLGGGRQTNVVFLGAGDSNSISTEGIVVKISPLTPYLTVENADNSETAANRWSALNASISVGDTVSMFLPDLKNSASNYTVIDKRRGSDGVQLVISGDTTGLSTVTHATAEFSCTGTIPSGTGIVEFAAPSNTLLTDLSILQDNDRITFGYTPTTSPNNATSYTVDFYSDETKKNSRVRLYVKEATASENRTGLYTEVKKISVRPRLSLVLSV